MTAAPLVILLARFPWLKYCFIGVPIAAQRLLIARTMIWNVPLRPGEEI